MSVSRYPLQWPSGRPRRKADQRKDGHFGIETSKGRRALTVAEALGRLERELERLGATLPVLSSNLELKLDGSPRGGQSNPDDPGVAVYFQLGRKSVCMPSDSYKRAADNLAAIAAHIEATRAISRHGVASVSEMFSAFEQLPAPRASDGDGWWTVLGIPRASSASTVENAYRSLAQAHHPDRQGGSVEKMAEINAARDMALREKLEG